IPSTLSIFIIFCLFEKAESMFGAGYLLDPRVGVKISIVSNGIIDNSFDGIMFTKRRAIIFTEDLKKILEKQTDTNLNVDVQLDIISKMNSDSQQNKVWSHKIIRNINDENVNGLLAEISFISDIDLPENIFDGKEGNEIADCSESNKVLKINYKAMLGTTLYDEIFEYNCEIKEIKFFCYGINNLAFVRTPENDIPKAVMCMNNKDRSTYAFYIKSGRMENSKHIKLDQMIIEPKISSDIPTYSYKKTIFEDSTLLITFGMIFLASI
ncbi:MAG: hypothetical protein MHPSP_002284, partial [Paramarteilia canceri]